MIKIELEKPAPVFAPAEKIGGTVTWDQADGTSMEVRLIWYTVGKGDRDFELVAVHNVTAFAPSGSERFEFVAPARPQSFSGKLVSLQWAVEAIVFPDQSAERTTLTISNTGQEIVLGSSSPTDAA